MRRGYSLLEMVVALAVSALLTAGLVTLFQLHGRAARRQSQLAELQQSARIGRREMARHLRMCGRGGLPASGLPEGPALAVRNNVGAGARIGGSGTPSVVEGSDVVVVRGVFEAGPVAVRPRTVGAGGVEEIVAHRRAPAGAAQELGPLAAAVEEGAGEALLISGGIAGSDWGVFELLGGRVRADPATGEVLEVALVFRGEGSELADAYRALGAGAGGSRVDAAWAGILDEYRYYVRRDPSPFTGEPLLRLSRARFFPNTERRHPSVPSAAEDIADGAVDLQVALGADLDGDGRLAEGGSGGRAADEWLLNDPGDEVDAPVWREAEGWALRLTTLFRSVRPERGYLSPPLERLEDRLYDESERPRSAAEWTARRHRRLAASAAIRLRELR